MSTTLYPQGFWNSESNVITGQSISATSPLSVVQPGTSLQVVNSLAGQLGFQWWQLASDFAMPGGANNTSVSYSAGAQFAALTYTPSTATSKILINVGVTAYVPITSSQLANGPSIAIFLQQSGTPFNVFSLRGVGSAGNYMLMSAYNTYIYNSASATLPSTITFYFCCYGYSSPYGSILSTSSTVLSGYAGTSILLNSSVV